jgi:murein DD-endopeptidase MepM/ murein hydrolase activator NlpD
MPASSRGRFSMKHKTLFFSAATLFILFLTILSTPAYAIVTDDGMEVPFYRVNHFFDSEENYHYITKHLLNFKDVDFKIYNVVRGDNFWKIAKNNNINIDTLISCNPHWTSLLARTNQKIVIPSKRGVLLFIEDKDKLDEIAAYFEIEKSEIEVQYIPIEYKYQKITGLKPLPIAIFVPKKKPTTYTMTEPMGNQYTLREMFRSPLGGRFTSFFGQRNHPIFNRRKFHNGVDIAAKRGTLIGAAAGGKVIFTGWRGGYGKCVIIKHKEGYQTLYGHMSTILIKKGSTVNKGQIIGRVGSTGYSTGPHLHFTLWHNGELLNPMKVLW